MPVVITSPHNPRIKQVVRLRERRQRDREGLMLVEGFEELSLALASGATPQALFVCPALVDESDEGQAKILADLRQAGAEVIEATLPVFEKIAYRENPDGWLAVVPVRRRQLADLGAALDAQPASAALLLAAEAVEKPGNLGAVLRVADAAGAHGLIVCDPATDVSNPNVVRSSRGTLFTVPVVEATGAQTVDWLKARGIAIVAATPQGSTPYTEADLRGPVAIAVGAENEGLSRGWLEQADVDVRIPMSGRVNSLNVATAAALLLYEAVRQRSNVWRVTSDA